MKDSLKIAAEDILEMKRPKKVIVVGRRNGRDNNDQTR